MRLAVVLALALCTPIGSAVAAADDAPPKPAPAAKPAVKIPLRVVRVMPESHQALLFDRDRATHVLAEVGATIDGFEVTEIADDTVTLTADGAQFVLAGPERAHRGDRHGDRDADRDDRHDDEAPALAAKTQPPAPAAKAAPVDPYADDAPAAAPVDPYAEAAHPVEPVRVVEAPPPITAGDGGVRVVDAQAPEAPAAAPAPAPAPPATAPVPAIPAVTVTPADLVDNTASPVGAAAGGATAPAVEDPVLVLTRPELATALADFGKLAAGIHATFAPGGVHVDGVVAGSLFARVGLRAGDLISAVDGQPLRSLDDAADLYARAAAARNLTLTVVRGGKPASLRVTIK